MSYYFNAASHGLPAENVYNTMARYFQSEARVGPQETLELWAQDLLSAKKAVSGLISAPLDQVGITSTTTAAWHAVVSKLDLAGKRVLVTEHDWGDYYRILTKRSDIEIQVLPTLDFNKPDVSRWAPYMDQDVAAVFVPMVTSVAGFRYPVEAIGALPRPPGTKLIIDAAQALGQMPVDVGALNCDAIISTCRKWLCGPRQTALFWIAESWQSNGVALNAKAMAPADQNPALMVGLGAAIAEYARQSPNDVHRKLVAQGSVIRSWADKNGIGVFGGGMVQSPTVSLILNADMHAKVEQAFSKHGIVAKMVSVAHVEPLLAGRGLPQNVLRLSPHIYTSDTDFERLQETLSKSIM